MFIKVLSKTYNKKTHYYASLVENKRVDGKVVQSVKVKHWELVSNILDKYKYRKCFKDYV